MPDSSAGDASLYGWLTLALTPGVGAAARKRLLERCGSVDAILKADADALRTVAGDARAAALVRPDAQREQQIEQALAWARAPCRSPQAPR